MPILVDEQGGIIAGHGRVLAARSLGHKDVPVVIASGWSETKKRAYVIADNKLALNAGWDSDMLLIEIEELKKSNFEMELLGFNAEDLEKIISDNNFEPGTEEDQGKLDQLEPKWIDCPHCGKEFDARQG
jgi:ParB-like chromosome segregation protein Spo0J